MVDEISQSTEIARRKFSKSIKEYRKNIGQYIDIAPPLPQCLLETCRVFSSRLDMICSNIVPKGGVWAEVGVDKAEFSKKIIEICNPSILHLLDIDTDRIDYANIQAVVDVGRVKVHKGDSSEILKSFDDGYFDVIYIDGDHYYDGIKKDIEEAYRKIKKNGFLIFNDYTSWSPISMCKCGVAKAVNEFIISSSSLVVAIALQGSGYYDVAVKVIK